MVWCTSTQDTERSAGDPVTCYWPLARSSSMRPDRLRAMVCSSRHLVIWGAAWAGRSAETSRRRARHHAPNTARRPSAATSLRSSTTSASSCHRPGEVAPMSLITYRDVRPWASAIREKVTTRVMPPWHADRQYGTFRNDLSLTQTRDRHDRSVGWRRRARRQSVRRCLRCRSSPRAGRSGRPIRCSRCKPTIRCRRPARSTTSTSRSRPTSPKTGGCRRAKCAPAIARTCITSSST